MTDDPTRSTARPDLPRYGPVGPADPQEDPVTRPAMLPPQHDPTATHPPQTYGDPADAERPTVRSPLPDRPPEHGAAPTVATPKGGRPIRGLSRTRTGWLWTGLILSAIVLLLLLVFILQNGAPIVINFLGFSGTLPTGVALLFAAIAGLLLVAIPGGLRILQLRRAARRVRR